MNQNLEPKKLELFNSHLEECISCKNLVTEVSATLSSSDNSESLKADPFLYTRLMQEIENRSTAGLAIRFQRILQPIAAAAIIIIGIYVGIGLGNNYSLDREGFASIEDQTLIDDYLFNDIEYESAEIFLLNE